MRVNANRASHVWLAQESAGNMLALRTLHGSYFTTPIVPCYVDPGHAADHRKMASTEILTVPTQVPQSPGLTKITLYHEDP